MTTSNSKHLIIACDGGGIRGLITALLLDQLNQDHPEFLSQAYLHAGTSTGGIISLALACAVPTDQLVKLYSEDGAQIFTPSACASASAATSLAAVNPPAAATAAGESWWEFFLKYFDEIICPWYDNTGLQSAIESKLGNAANATLNSLIPTTGAKQYVLVNTFQLCDSKNVWNQLQLTNLPNLKNNNSGETRVIDAAMSTSAAPMYFPPYNHPTYGYCADGGLFANNPGAIALTTLIESGIALDDIWMLSLSTGNTQNCYPASTINTIGANSFGPIYWIWPLSQPYPAVSGQPYTPSLPLMGAVFDGASEVGAYQCAQLLPGRFKRANVPLTQPVELDDHSAEAIKAMTRSTNDYIKSSSEWSDIQTWITKNFG
jgi:predicted acylesterase/phospholipase RssA